MKKKREEVIKQEYEVVNQNPLLKGVVQALITVIDLVIMFVLIWNLFTFFIPKGSWLNIVDGTSMESTLHSSQIIFTDMSEIERGDIVTSHVPESVVEKYPKKDEMVVIKRVIGVPGDRIKITKEGIYVNDTLLEEPYVDAKYESFTYKEEGKNNLLLGDNEYYLVGDNREVSYDSRAFGPVEAEDLMFKQSEKPTTNFWLKSLLVLLILAFDIFIYMLIEFILMELAYAIFYKKRKEAKITTTTETVELKGDQK